jgi:hypothetical protein
MMALIAFRSPEWQGPLNRRQAYIALSIPGAILWSDRRQELARYGPPDISFACEQFCARPENLSSGVQNENHLCHIKDQLPRVAVYKPGDRLGWERRVCMFVHERYLRKL